MRDLIDKVAQSPTFSEQEFLAVLIEAKVLTSLHTAEAVKAKLLIIAGLHERVMKQALENEIRDYISANPWLIEPKWETFQVEKSVEHVIESAVKESGIDKDADWNKRIDLVLTAESNCLYSNSCGLE